MKHAENAFQLLLDQYSYTIDSYLRLDLSSKTLDEIKIVLGGSSFLIDKLFAKENAGKEITKLIEEEIDNPNLEKLVDEAAKLKLAMDKKEILPKGSPLKNYLDWLRKSEDAPSYLTCDSYGRLALATLDDIVSLTCDEQSSESHLRITELLFLNIVDAFYQIYMNLDSDTFKRHNSYIGFKQIDAALDDIRKHIYD
ncbi:MAG TPA: hypothetical protein DD377_06365 [Firmicutes bacterium]|nr:hypothetical protein [Bacillota bacterium]